MNQRKGQRLLLVLMAAALIASVLAASSAAQVKSAGKPTTASAEGASGYNTPPQAILDVMRAPGPPDPMVSPTHEAILLVTWQDYPSIVRVAMMPGMAQAKELSMGMKLFPCSPTLLMSRSIKNAARAM